MGDLNIYNPSFTKDMPAQSRACLYGIVPVSHCNGRMVFNYLILSPGHTTGTENVGDEQMADLMQNLLVSDNLDTLRAPRTERIMLRAVPSGDWLRYRNHIPENKLIIRLPDGFAPNHEQERIMLGMRRAGAQFAMSLGDMGTVPQNEALLDCIDYLFIANAQKDGLLTAFIGLKVKHPHMQNIGFKEDIGSFTVEEAQGFDLVAGHVQPALLPYKERPLWQHELLRSVAEVFSGIYNPKQIVRLGVKYPEMGAAIKKVFSSKKLLSATVRRGAAYVSNANMHYSPSDMVNLMCACLMYGLLCETDKAERSSRGDNSPYKADELSSPFIYFKNALIAGRVISRFAAMVCDDYETNHAFMVGMIMYMPKIIRDSRDHCNNEFMLSAIADYYKGNGALGLVLKGYLAMVHKDTEALISIADRLGISFPKEVYYGDYFEALQWSDTLLGVISGRIDG